MTKGRIKLELVTALMFSPLLLLLFAWHPTKIHADQFPPQNHVYRVMWYPDCSPAWAGGTIWQNGLCVPDCSYGIQTGPNCTTPVYIPGIMPQIIGTNTAACMFIDISTNYCSTGDILMGYAYTEQRYLSYGAYTWGPVPGTTNQVVMANGMVSLEWNVVSSNLVNLLGVVDAVPVLAKTSSFVRCPGGIGSGGQ